MITDYIESLVKDINQAHIRLTPSSADNWLSCVGASMANHRPYSYDIPKVQGIIAASYLEHLIKNHQNIPHDCHVNRESWEVIKLVQRLERIHHDKSSDYSDLCREYCKETIINLDDNWDIEQEIVDTVKPIFKRLLDMAGDGWEIWAEQKVVLSPYFGHTFTDGYIDVLAFKGGRCQIIDLKYGAGKAIYPYENKQLILYALGAIVYANAMRGYSPESFSLVICQPRIEGNEWNEWNISAEKVESYIGRFLSSSVMALEYMKGFNHAFNPSPDACNGCYNRMNCPDRYNEYDRVLERIKSFKSRPTNEQLAYILDYDVFIKKTLKDAHTEVKKRARKGERVPGRKVVPGIKRRQWKIKEPEKLVKALKKKGVKPDDMIVKKLKSPHAIEQIEGIKPADISELVDVIQGADVVVLDTDRRISTTETVSNAFNDFMTGDT